MNTPYELVYRINPDVEHIHTFRCVVKAGEGVKLNALIKFGKWANLMENSTDKNIRTVIFDNAKGLVARQMKELCNEHNIWIISSVLYSPSSNSVTTNGTWVMSHGSRLPL